MAEVTLTIHGRNYGISCDDGQEQRVLDLAAYVDQRVREMAGAGAANNDNHLLVLSSILLADEIFDLREQLAAAANGAAPEAAPQTNGHAPDENEEEIAGAIDNLAQRINAIADRLQGA